MIDKIKDLLIKCGAYVVQEQTPDGSYGRSDGYLVVQTSLNTFYRVDYSQDSYGDEVQIDKIYEVKPKQVSKVEYV